MIGVLAVVPKGVPGNSLYPVAKRLVTALPEFTLTDKRAIVRSACAPHAGRVQVIHFARGDRVPEGSQLLELTAAEDASK